MTDSELSADRGGDKAKEFQLSVSLARSLTCLLPALILCLLDSGGREGRGGKDCAKRRYIFLLH